MRSVLVVYGTGDGQTEKIARFIAHRLDMSGTPVVLVNAAGGSDPDPADFGSVIVAASVHAGGYQRAVRKWVRRHALQLTTHDQTGDERQERSKGQQAKTKQKRQQCEWDEW